MIYPGSPSESVAEGGLENSSCLNPESGFSASAPPRASAHSLPPLCILSYLEADIVGAALALGQVGAALATPGPGKEAQRVGSEVVPSPPTQRLDSVVLPHLLSEPTGQMSASNLGKVGSLQRPRFCSLP